MKSETKLPDGLQLAEMLVGVARDHAIFDEQREQCGVAIDAIRAEHDQRLTLQHHAADQAQRVADLEAERDTARGAVRELERTVFNQGHALNVLRACVDRHQRDAADPPGYLQDAVIRAAGLGALHMERDAAIKERDELRARLAEIEGQEPVTWRCMGCGSSEPLEDLQARGHIACCPEREMRHLYARPVPAIQAGWRLVPVDPTPGMIQAVVKSIDDFLLGDEAEDQYRADWAAMLAAAPEAAR